MGQQLNNKDFLKDGIFDQFITEVAEAEKALDGLENKFSELGKKAKGSVEGFDLGKTADIKKLDDVIQDLVKSIEELSKVQKQRRDIDQALTKEQKAIIKLNKDNKDSVEDNRIELQKLRVEKALQNKQDRRTAVLTSKLTTEYQKQTAELQDLRDKQKDLILSGDTTSDTFLRQNKRLQELDETLKETDAQVGQFQRSVGNYEKAGLAAARATEKLQKSLDGIKGGAAALGGILAGGGLVGKALSSTQGGADGLRIATEAVDKSINALFASISTGVTDAITRFGTGATGLTKVLLGLAGAITGATKGVPAFLKTLEQQAAITKATIEFERSLNDRLLEGGKIRKGLTRTLLEQSIAFERNLALSDQDTRNLIERSKFLEIAEEKAEEAFETETKIANGRLALAQKELKLAGDEGLLIVQAEAKITEARSDLDQINSNRVLQRIELAERQGKILSDQFELDLDLLIDFTDRVKTVNEKLINNEDLSAKARQAILDDTVLSVEGAIDDQVNKFNEIENAQRKIDKATAEGELVKNVQLEQNEELNLTLEDFNRLLNLNAENLSEEAKRLGLSEIGQNRLKESILEAVTARADLIEINKELIKSEENLADDSGGDVDVSLKTSKRKTPESIRKNLTEKLNKDIQEGTIRSTKEIDQRKKEIEREATDRAIFNNEDLIGNRTELEKELIQSFETVRALQIQLSNEVDEKEREALKNKIQREIRARENSIISLEFTTEAEIELDKLKTDKAVANIKKREDAEKRSIAVVQTALGAAIDQDNKRRRKAIDDEIEDSKRRQQTLEILAAQGSEDADKNLANERKLQNDAELERKKQIRREKIEEFALAGIKAYSANAGEPNAVGKTLTDLALVSAGIRALLPAYDGYDGEGTDDSGPTQGNRDSFGGIKGFFHDREQVWSKKDRSAVGWRGRDEIKDIVKAHDSKVGSFDTPVVVSSSGFDSSAEVLKKFDRLESAIKNQPKQQNYYDAYKKAIVEEVREGNRVTRNHRKVGGLFGGSKN